MKTFMFALATLLPFSSVLSQALPPIFGSTPRRVLKSKVLVSFPKNTWLENLVMGDDGELYVTDYPEGKVFKVSRSGTAGVYATIKGKIAGIARYHKNEFLVVGWDDGGKPALFRIDAKGNVSLLVHIQNGMFPNGILYFSWNKYLITDSFAGCIWLYDAADNSISTWLKSQLLERSSEKSQYPAANGLKIYKDQLYISNTEKQTLVKLPLQGEKPGTPELYLDKVNIDDFTFDEAGNIYAATNVYNYVIKITPEKKITIVAGLQEGVAGCTAIVSATNPSGDPVLYISTNGGMAIPSPAGVEEGKIVELSLH